jgi:hypothetical protein|tara:strand:- start:272 stop:607 length:336 start_codon:yes stop_codon:yes gene_type:complete
MAITRTIADSLRNPAVKHFKISSLTQIYFAINHIAGNVDLFYNGILLLPEIGDDTGSQANFTSVDYDFQSGTADNDLGTDWAPITTAGGTCTYIKMSFTLLTNDIISIRSY